MKLSIESANKLLKELGVSAQVVEDDKADKDVDKKGKGDDKSPMQLIIDEYLDGIKTDYRKEVESEVTTGAEKAATGRVFGAVASAIAREFKLEPGIRAELAKIDKNDDFAKKVKAAYDDMNSKTQQEWEKQNQDLQDQLDKASEAHETALKAKETEWQSKYDGHFINNSLVDIVSKLPKKGGDVLELAENLQWKLQKEGYELKYNHEKKTMEPWKDGKVVKDFDAAAYGKTWLEKNNNLATDTRDLKPKDVDTRRADYDKPEQAVQGESRFEWLNQ